MDPEPELPHNAGQESAGDHALDEYKDLRAEVLQSQNTRILLLGFSFTLVTAASGVVLKLSTKDVDCGLATGLLGFGAVTLCAAVHMTTVLTQRIDRLSEFIRARLEQSLGFRWESDWTNYRENLRQRSSGGLPLGTSKALAVYYLALVAGLAAVDGATAHASCPARVWVPAPALLVALFLVLNLHQRFPFMLGWTDLYAQRPKRKLRRSSPRANEK